MLTLMDVKKWFSETSRSQVTDTVIADILNVTRKTANKRVNEGMSADDLITISNALGINPVIALVEFDFIDYDNVADFLDSDGQLIATAEPAHLAIELARKLNPATSAPELDELDARRRQLAASPAPLPTEWEHLAVADSSPDHPEEDTDDFD